MAMTDTLGGTLGLGPVLYSGTRDELQAKLRARDDEIDRLRKELAAAREALADFDKTVAAVGGCSDGYCLVMGRARGMHTNGGCRCNTDKHTARRMMLAGRMLRDDISAALGEGQK